MFFTQQWTVDGFLVIRYIYQLFPDGCFLKMGSWTINEIEQGSSSCLCVSECPLYEHVKQNPRPFYNYNAEMIPNLIENDPQSWVRLFLIL